MLSSSFSSSSSSVQMTFTRKMHENPWEQEGENALCSPPPWPPCSVPAWAPRARVEYLCKCSGGGIPWSLLVYTHNEHMLASQYLRTDALCAQTLPRSRPRPDMRAHRRLMPLLLTCNYVAMMSLISCTGWKQQRRVIRKCWKVRRCMEY